LFRKHKVSLSSSVLLKLFPRKGPRGIVSQAWISLAVILHATQYNDIMHVNIKQIKIEKNRIPLQSFIKVRPKICSSASLISIGLPNSFPGPTMAA